MSIKLDRQDLRVIVAAIQSLDRREPTDLDAVQWADALLAEIDRTAPKAEPESTNDIPAWLRPDAGLKRMTPLETTIQKLMEPDKNGNVGRPIRRVAMESFGRIENRTLDALWKYAEDAAAGCATCPTVDGIRDLTNRAESAEGCLAEEYDKRKAAEAELAAYEAQNRGSIDQWEALERRAEAAEAQVKELEAWKESALKVMNGISFQAVGKELGVPLGKAVGPEILTGIRGLRAQISEAMDTIAIYEHYARTWYGPDGPEILATEEEVTQRRKDAAARLAAIDAAKAGELPMPDEGLAASCHLVAWGRQGWDAAAALRVELEREQAHSQEGTQIMGRLEAMATQARAEGEKAERERCANALAEWVEYRMADGDAVRILAFLQGGAHD